MQINLPIHPSLRHPLTGEPIRAVYVDQHGRPRYPIMGGAPDDGDKGGDSGGSGGDADKDAGAAKDTGGDRDTGDKGSNDKGGEGKDLGFPSETPVAEMTAAQQAAYWRHNAQKHEGRNRELLRITGGKHGDDLKADIEELNKLRTAQLTDGEKAVESAKLEGRREASLALAPQMFDVALSHVEEERRKVLIDSVDLTRVIADDGTIDAVKVKSISEALAPADKGSGTGGQDYGQGRRGAGSAKGGVSAGADMYAASRKKPTTS